MRISILIKSLTSPSLVSFDLRATADMESISLLFRLPKELRLMIYELIAEDATIICQTTGVKSVNADITRTCSQARAESEKMFYRLSRIHFETGDALICLIKNRPSHPLLLQTSTNHNVRILAETNATRFSSVVASHLAQPAIVQCLLHHVHDVKQLSMVLWACCYMLQIELGLVVIAKMKASNAKDEFGHGLCSAIYRRNEELIHAMLEAGADINTVPNHDTVQYREYCDPLSQVLW